MKTIKNDGTIEDLADFRVPPGSANDEDWKPAKAKKAGKPKKPKKPKGEKLSSQDFTLTSISETHYAPPLEEGKAGRKLPMVARVVTSISGEVGGTFPAGGMAHIFRFAGCNLRCAYCDAVDALDGTAGIPFDEAVSRLRALIVENPYAAVLVTGGEPLLYPPEVRQLFKIAAHAPLTVPFIVETNGTLPPDVFGSPDVVTQEPVLRYSHFIVDIKMSLIGDWQYTWSLQRWAEDRRLSSVTFKIVVGSTEEVSRAVDFVRKMVVRTGIGRAVNPTLPWAFFMSPVMGPGAEVDHKVVDEINRVWLQDAAVFDFKVPVWQMTEDERRAYDATGCLPVRRPPILRGINLQMHKVLDLE